MKSLIVANWKLNPSSQKEAEALFDAVSSFAKASASQRNADVVICPPFIYLPLLKGLPLGGQDMFWEEKGSFTGEISAKQLLDAGAEYVILGHSERRKYFGETNESVNKKIKAALATGLKVIFCIGENAGEDKNAVLEKQIKEGLSGVNGQLLNVIIAYEPVWAIGTGNNCSIEETKSSVELIKSIIADISNKESSDAMQILYGGSVNSKNSGEYIKEAGVAGLLVGGASLDAEEFIKIIESAN